MKEKRKTGLSRLLELAGNKKKKLLVACCLSVVSALSRIIFFFTIYGVIREILLHYNAPDTINMNKIILYTGITLGGIVLYGLCSYISSCLSHTAAYDLLYEIRIQLMDKMSRISMGYFNGTTQGAIKKIMTDDVEEIEVFVAHNLSDVAAGVAAPLFTIIFLFCMDIRLALVTLLPIIISVTLLGICLKQKDKAALQKEMADRLEQMTATIVEFIHGIPVIKVFNRSLGAFKRYRHDIDAFVDSVDKTAKANALPMGLYYVFFGAQMLFLLPASILILQKSHNYTSTVLTVILFFLIGQGLKEPLENMMNLIIGMNRINESVKRIDNILYQPDIISDGNEIPETFSVDYENVNFSYDGKRNVLSDINVHIGQGMVCGIVGPSGSGKTTFLELLLRFYPLDSGCIRIGGIDITKIPHSVLMDKIAFVFQDSMIFTDTALNNIRMGNDKATLEQVMDAAKNASIHDVIMQLPQGYQTVLGTQNSYLSGGEKQRLAIARLFLKDAPIVVMDEATAYADAENESRIQEAFAKLSKDKTVFIIAHRIRTIANADKIMVFNDGKIIACDSHEALYQTCPLYQNMVKANERRDDWTIRKGKSANYKGDIANNAEADKYYNNDIINNAEADKYFGNDIAGNPNEHTSNEKILNSKEGLINA